MFKIVEVPSCPVKDIRDCPLYVASHDTGLPGCCTGDWAMGCEVARGDAPFAERVAELRWSHREWWASS